MLSRDFLVNPWIRRYLLDGWQSVWLAMIQDWAYSTVALSGSSRVFMPKCYIVEYKYFSFGFRVFGLCSWFRSHYSWWIGIEDEWRIVCNLYGKSRRYSHPNEEGKHQPWPFSIIIYYWYCASRLGDFISRGIAFDWGVAAHILLPNVHVGWQRVIHVWYIWGLRRVLRRGRKGKTHYE